MNKDKCDHCHQWMIGCRGYENQVLCPECLNIALTNGAQHSLNEMDVVAPTERKAPEQTNIFEFMRK